MSDIVFKSLVLLLLIKMVMLAEGLTVDSAWTVYVAIILALLANEFVNLILEIIHKFIDKFFEKEVKPDGK